MKPSKRRYHDDEYDGGTGEDAFPCENAPTPFRSQFSLSAQKRRRDTVAAFPALGDVSNIGFREATASACCPVAVPCTTPADVFDARTKIAQLESELRASKDDAEGVRKENQLLKRAVVVQSQQIQTLTSGKAVRVPHMQSHKHTRAGSAA